MSQNVYMEGEWSFSAYFQKIDIDKWLEINHRNSLELNTYI